MYIYKIIIVCSLFLVVGCQGYNYDFDNGFDVGDLDPSTITTDTTGFTIDKSKYDEARIFPGLVDESEKRIDTLISFNLNKRITTASNLGVKTVPKPIISTGLYAAPGELVQITIPEGVYGIQAQIGVHTDDLSSIVPSKRAPLIYSVNELIPGVNNVRNPFGGCIWLVVKQNLGKVVDIRFKGAVKSPDYILGVTQSVAQWKNEVTKSQVPWLELRGPHISFTVPISLVKRAIDVGKLDNVDQLLTRWESIITEDYYKFIGLTVGSGDLKHRAPEFPERAILDAQLEGQVYTHIGGQPLVAQLDQYWFDEWTNLEMINSGQSWGTFRSFGYNYEFSKSPFWSTLTNTTPNLYAFKIAGINNDLPTLGANGVNTQFPLALQYAARSTENYFDNDVETANWIFKLTPFIQLFHKISNPTASNSDGWGLYPYLINKLNSQQIVATDDMSKRNFFFTGLTEYTHVDYSAFFDAWGIAISDFARAQASVYPALSTKLWEYNPITKLGGDSPFVVTRIYHNRTNWILSASSEELVGETFPNGRVAALIDGNPNSFWHTHYTGTEIPPPHQINVDMGQLNVVNGIYISSRLGGTRAQNVNISVSLDGFTYTNMGSFSLADRDKKQFLSFSQDQTFRYFKIVIPTNNYGNRPFVAMAEIGTYKNQ